MEQKIKFPQIFLLLLAFSQNALAFCPLCVVAVGSGLGFSEYLGIDNAIIGIWLGALNVSLIIWTIDWLVKHNWKFFAYKTIVTLSYFISLIVPLYYQHFVGHPLNLLWGIDKLILGIIVGSIVLAVSVGLHNFLKVKHGNKSYFPFQKVMLPVVLLMICSEFFYIITKV